MHRLASRTVTLHGEQRPASRGVAPSTVLELESADAFAFVGRVLAVAGAGAATGAVARSRAGGQTRYAQVGQAGAGHCHAGQLRSTTSVTSAAACQALCSAEADCFFVSYRLD